MLTCYFIHQILIEFNRIHAEEPPLLKKQDLKNYVFLKTEAALALRELHDLLNDYASVQTKLNADVLNDFKRLLRNRWLFIKGTDAIYSHTPYSRVNQAYSIVAKYICQETNEIDLNLLMPGYGFTDEYKKKNTKYTMRPQDYILRDNDKPQVIIFALDRLKQITLGLPDPSPGRPPLTDDEITRCAFHSPAATEYYRAIVTKAEDKFAELRLKLSQEMASERYTVTSSYAKSPERLLRKFLEKIHNQSDLLDFLTLFVPRDGWSVFLGALPNEIFFEKVLGVSILEKQKLNEDKLAQIFEKLTLEIKKPPFQDPILECSFVFSLLEAYQRYANAAPEFNTTFGAWVGKAVPRMSGTYPKSDKIEACIALKNCLALNRPLDDKHAGPLASGTLRELSNRVSQLKALQLASVEIGAENYSPAPKIKSL